MVGAPEGREAGSRGSGSGSTRQSPDVAQLMGSGRGRGGSLGRAAAGPELARQICANRFAPGPWVGGPSPFSRRLPSFLYLPASPPAWGDEAIGVCGGCRPGLLRGEEATLLGVTGSSGSGPSGRRLESDSWLGLRLDPDQAGVGRSRSQADWNEGLLHPR